MIRVAGCDKVGRPLLPCLAMLSHARQLTPIHTDDEEKERERERERERCGFKCMMWIQVHDTGTQEAMPNLAALCQ